MKAYIHATGNISAQKTFGHPPLLQVLVEQSGNRMRCTEPDYSAFIDVKMIRRMSRIIKMGVAAAMECLQEAGVKNPDAIVTGTAYGCLEDTGIFLKKMVQQNEEMLTPTAFIQSTHNTIGGQIALLLQCHRYNNTFVHRGFSFESALLDAMMLLEEGNVNNVLAGSVDEITDISHAILSRFGLYKNGNVSNNSLYNDISGGSIAGEGAAFFLLTRDPSKNDYAVIDGLHTFYKPANIIEVSGQILSFLENISCKIDEIDLIIIGKSGDEAGDAIYTQIGQSVFANIPAIPYKNLCGEYPTSNGFALWLAAGIIKSGNIPSTLNTAITKKIKRVLIYNHYQNIHHSLLLLSAC